MEPLISLYAPTAFFVLVSVVTSGFLVWLANQNRVYRISDQYSRIFSIAFLSTAVITFFHGVEPTIQGLHSDWIYFTWALARFNILAPFLMVLGDERLHMSFSRWKPAQHTMLGVAPIVGLLTFFTLYPNAVPSLYFHISENIVIYPIDVIFVGIWIILLVMLNSRKHKVFPPGSFGLFVSLSIIAHLLHSVVNITYLTSTELITNIIFMIQIAIYGIFFLVLQTIHKHINDKGHNNV